MTRGERAAFGAVLEAAKAAGQGGTKNARGDFTREELRAEARSVAGKASTDRAIDQSADRREAERAVAKLVGQELESSAGATLRLTSSTLHVHNVRWMLRQDGFLVATHHDEGLEEIEGLVVTEATMRRRDAALTLTFEDYELQVRAPRRGQSWELDGIHFHG